MQNDAVILTVDTNRRNQELLTQFLNKEGYQTICADSLEEFEQALAGSQDIKLALVDLAGFDPRIWECCEELRRTAIPFLIISPKQTGVLQQESLAHGARGVLVKPLVLKEFLGLIRNLLDG